MHTRHPTRIAADTNTPCGRLKGFVVVSWLAPSQRLEQIRRLQPRLRNGTTLLSGIGYIDPNREAKLYFGASGAFV